ncbi:SusC/RagA family TonB-linked outer membrane protein [Dyadobacter bucti]|uniref:SusC/RagA family TonB-linked outer membrane protein n=1 Tax=Dyadobacter bucti TaxID=2572203 RepID=UPI001E3ED070|nr:SusC/RagA family TonB-linked outer membrane protein [Dyadobacter bucti]
MVLAAVFLLSGSGYAQIRVTGKVTSSEDSSPMPGVNVLIKGTSVGTISDGSGNYAIEVPGEGTALLFSSVGFNAQEILVGKAAVIHVSLSADPRQLSEVVVTALGFSREKKALGYTVQEIKGSQLDQARETNLISSLAGKVAGVNITGGSNALGGSARVVIRGETSLTGNNQPLFVVDGVPIDNSSQGSGQRGATIDYGNAASEINPDDIQTITVLKGPNAAALYGSRAANGVILITTKSGKDKAGLGISVNSTTSFENPLRLPDLQNRYGQGRGGVYNIGDGGRSWGPALDGQMIAIPVNTEWPPKNGEQAPWLPYPDNVKEFYETGRTLNNNISVSTSNENGNVRLSYTNLDQTGMVPNTDLKRNTFAMNGSYKLGKKLTVTSSMNYVNSSSDNRTVVGYGNESIVYTWLWEGRQVRTDKMRDYWVKGLEGRQPFTYNYSFNDNPYYTVYENTNGMNRNRVVGNIAATYNFTKELSLMVRSGMDFSNERRDSRRTYGSNAFPLGMYRQEQVYFQERNSDFLLSYDKTVNKDWSLKISAGGNQMDQRRDFLSNQANELSIPGIYNLGNSRIPIVVNQFDSKYRISSLYALGQVAFQNSVFLDLTARNDWSSTLPVKNNSYFYPSVSLSTVLTNFLPVPDKDILSFAKLRLSWAQVGNDTDPYRLRNVYNYASPWQSLQAVTEPASIPNSGLVPEAINTFEIGADVRFFKNRLGLDVAYYDTRSKNQILNIPIDATSGYSSRFLNAGEIRSRGLEIVLNATPVKLDAGFQWNIDLNWSANRAKVVSLVDGIDTYVLNSRYISSQARVGERMGDMYGRGTRRDPAGNPVYVNGLPQQTTDLVKLGNYNPDWSAGLSNTFSYKGLILAGLLDFRKGGAIYTYTQVRGNVAGQLVESLDGREGKIWPGVIANPDGTYRPNDVKVTAERYYEVFYNAEEATHDATYLKLRELKLGYKFPNSLMKKFPVRDLTVQIVGRNLALWTKVPHIDPDTSGYTSGGDFLPGIEDMSLPTPRSLGFNINFKL